MQQVFEEVEQWASTWAACEVLWEFELTVALKKESEGSLETETVKSVIVSFLKLFIFSFSNIHNVFFGHIIQIFKFFRQN